MQSKIGETLAKLGMSMGVFVLNKGGNGANTLAAGKPEFIEIFLRVVAMQLRLLKDVMENLQQLFLGL
jgi:hydroxypyruvate isomerase